MGRENIRVLELKAGEKLFVSLDADRSDAGAINKNFQISIRPLTDKDAGFTDVYNLNQTPVLKIRPTHGTKRGYSNRLTSNSTANKFSFGNAKADVFEENEDYWIGKEHEFQEPEKVFDLATGVSCLVFTDIYCSGLLLDNSAADPSDGTLFVTVIL